MPTATTSSPVPIAPGCIPGFGHLIPLMRRQQSFLASLRRYGPVVQLRLGTKRVFAVTEPELVHHMLTVEQDTFGRGRSSEKEATVLGKCLATTDGAFHRRNRRLVQPLFTHRASYDYLDAIRTSIERAIGGWRAGQVLRVERQMSYLASEVVGRVLFSAELGGAVLDEVHRSLPVLEDGVYLRILLPDSFARLPVPANRRFNSARDRLRAAIREVVATCRTDGTNRHGLISRYLDARDQDSGEGISDEHLLNEVITQLLGGTSTTASALSWAFHEIGRHPEVERRLHDEVDAAFTGGEITRESLARLDYTGRVVAETLRRYASPMIIRRALRPVDLAGTQLPTGAEVLYSPYALGQDARYYPDPARFDPERWRPERMKELPKGSYLPFGAGVHRCLGENLAIMEATMAVAMITSRWRLRPIPDRKAPGNNGFVLRPANLAMTLETR